MEPSGSDRARGFRAPHPEHLSDPAVLGESSTPAPTPTPTQAPTQSVERAGEQAGETLEAGPPASAGRGNAGRRRRLPRSITKPVSGRWFVGVCAVLALAVVLIAVLAFRLGSTAASSSGSSGPSASSSPPSPATSATPLPTTDLYTRVAPSVVLITTSKGALGSGTVVTDTGRILTANHVVSGGGDLFVTFADGTKTTATVASAMPQTDIATLVPKKLPEVVVPATLGGGAVVGQDVVAIGNPLGLRESTSTGIVSGVNRTNRSAAGTISGLIQFDAAVNPGSSGGPLLDNQANVIGVVLSIADPGKDDAFAGIGFAVSISSALTAGDQGPGQGGPQL